MSQPGRADRGDDQLAGHEGLPREAPRLLEPADVPGHRGREDHVPVELPAVGAQRATGALQQRRDGPKRADRRERHGRERPHDRDEHHGALAGVEPHDRQRHPGDERRDLQRDDQRPDASPREVAEREPDPDRRADHDRRGEREGESDERLQRGPGDRALPDAVDRDPPHVEGRGDRRG